MKFIDRRRATSFIRDETNCGPLSLTMVFGMPMRAKIVSSASAIVSVSIDFRQTASGTWVPSCKVNEG